MKNRSTFRSLVGARRPSRGPKADSCRGLIAGTRKITHLRALPGLFRQMARCRVRAAVRANRLGSSSSTDNKDGFGRIF
ncbi:hypothetical protein MMMDOFMJ_2601 [Methylobacterium gnaphalii]|nr:hypothetical protein MMMDOFMJ_2601 [Methylobacterium gnaphalii]